MDRASRNRLTEHQLDRFPGNTLFARIARARLAVLPCCHDLASSGGAELRGWLDGALAMDVARAARLQAAGYRVMTQTIPAEITPKNRLLLAEPE